MGLKSRLLDGLEELTRGVLSIALYCGVLVGVAYFAYGYALQFVQADPAPSASPAVAWHEIAPAAPSLSLEMGDFLAGTVWHRVRKHPDDGRHDLIGWRASETSARKLVIDVYRPGKIARPSRQADDFMPAPGEPLMILSKFGAFDARRGADPEGQPCVTFAQVSAADVEITGIFCDRVDAKRALETVACALDRLTLVNGHGDVRLAGVFARARLKQSSCRPGTLPTAAIAQRNAWIDAEGEPALRAGAR